jgi:protein-disulfide isomerase
VRGPEGAPLVTVYADFECPYCAWLELKLRDLPVRVCFRHFPVRSKHPRAWPAAQAVEAAANQDAFWAMHDSIYADQGRIEDPHLWARAEELGLDIDRFVREARSDAARERIQADFRSGIRAGVAATPTLFMPDGERVSGRPSPDVFDRLGASQ